MNLLQYMQDRILLLDGGMGTLLQAQGLLPGELPETWNLTHPDRITAIHKSYYDAGSNVVNTNTFGANGLKFSSAELEEIICAAVANAKKARTESASAQQKFIALDIGPTGKMLRPLGTLDFEDAVSLFGEVVRIGAGCGVDFIFIETMNDLYETKAALLAAKENCDLPVFVSCAYGEDGKLMTGASPAAVIATLEGMGADAIGVNCSLGPKALAPIVDEYLARASVPVLVKPNAGLPKVVGGKTVYDVLPEEFSKDVLEMILGGVRIAGGCCGTTPDYIAALYEKTASVQPVPVTEKNITCVSSYTHAVDFGAAPILIGERINPTGKKRFKEALRQNDMDYIRKEGIAQAECGVHILDVNVGLPEIDEVSMLTEAVCELQAILDIPLQIDTSSPAAMESALRRYNGKPMINSVSGKQESMDAVFPLAKKYGGVVVALTLDESGIPNTAEERVAIAERILKEAAKYGIGKKDILFDPLALTISADNRAGVETLRAVRMIRETLDCHTSLGISNVSFGLPRREIITATFYTLALGAGLSAAIMNPYANDMMNAYHAYLALSGLDDACAGYIAYAAALPASPAPSSANGSASVSAIAPQEKSNSSPKTNTAPSSDNASLQNNTTELQHSIIRGLKDQAGQITAAILAAGTEPLSIVQNEIIPALDIVGAGFENKTVYLPQLLMSAEAAKAAFGAIKAAASTETSKDKCAFILATVHGDIHDIGKNIVKLLLENYGFAVTDLGRDVEPQVIVDETVRQHAPLVGLSALMTTTVPAMEETIKQLRISAPWCKIVVGGAVLTQEYADAIGADHYAKDAMETVRYAEKINAAL
ncbi:MAG: homocysteine S-methyltransferase family protein [Clostridia bacterium]|nr:homocysteine S-methyltransferase family protein [Clostridia bacterium]